jgi:hypothetical protein
MGWGQDNTPGNPIAPFSDPVKVLPTPPPTPIEELEPVQGVFLTKNSTLWHRDIALPNTILRVEVGSTMHGVSVKKDDDVDELGVCIEPPEVLMGIGTNDAPLFAQYEYRTQPVNHRSGAGDIDRTVYSLRKYARMCAAGNPTVLMPLYAPQDMVRDISVEGRHLRTYRERFSSKLMGVRFLRYLENQRDRYLDTSRADTKHGARPELIEKYGWDTKAGYHALRIAIQGAQLLTEGTMVIPMHPLHVEYLTDVRNGVYSKTEVLEDLASRVDVLKIATARSTLPPEPDYRQISAWIAHLYQSHWKRCSSTP